MTITKDMLGLSVGLQATGLAVSNIPKFNSKKPLSSKKILKQGIGNMLGTSLISAQASMIKDIE